MVLVDTNVLAYLLIEGDHTAAAQKLMRRDPDWRSESFIMIEFGNVLVRYIAARRMQLKAGQRLLTQAEAILTNKLARVDHSVALKTAAELGITAYDARFVVLARQTNLKLVTEDARLRSAAPMFTQSLADVIEV